MNSFKVGADARVANVKAEVVAEQIEKANELDSEDKANIDANKVNANTEADAQVTKVEATNVAKESEKTSPLG